MGAARGSALVVSLAIAGVLAFAFAVIAFAVGFALAGAVAVAACALAAGELVRHPSTALPLPAPPDLLWIRESREVAETARRMGFEAGR